MLSASKEARKRGRKQMKHTAFSDFALADARKMYEEKLEQIHVEDQTAQRIAKSRGEILPRAKKEPCMRAAEAVVTEMSDDLRNISAKRLLNAFSETKYIDVKDEDYPQDAE